MGFIPPFTNRAHESGTNQSHHLQEGANESRVKARMNGPEGVYSTSQALIMDCMLLKLIVVSNLGLRVVSKRKVIHARMVATQIVQSNFCKIESEVAKTHVPLLLRRLNLIFLLPMCFFVPTQWVRTQLPRNHTNQCSFKC